MAPLLWPHCRPCLLLYQVLGHQKSLTPTKSMSQKSNHDSKEKYHYIHVGTLVPVRITAVLEYEKKQIMTGNLVKTKEIKIYQD